jgi:hypothetical protein
MRRRRGPPPPRPGPLVCPRARAFCEGPFGCGAEWAIGDPEKHRRGCKFVGWSLIIGFPLMFALFATAWILNELHDHGMTWRSLLP